MAGRRLRVLFISQTYVVGVNQQKLQALVGTGAVEVGLLVPKKWREPQWMRRLNLERPYSEIRMFPSAVWFEGRVGAYFYPPEDMRRAIASFRPDIVHVEQEAFSVSAFESALLTQIVRKPLALFCWENIDRPLSAMRRCMRRYVLGATRLIVAGNMGAAELVHSWGYEGPVEILPQLGVDARLFQPRPKRQDVVNIGFLGRLVREKGVDLLLIAVKYLRDRGLRHKLLICGSGPEADDLKTEAARLGLTEVTWKDAVLHHEVPDVMAEIDVLILPSRTLPGWKEQFGHVLIEAMSMGIPVVGSSCGEIPRVVGRDDAIFQEGDAEGLARILERTIREPEWRESIGEYGRHRVQQHYTHERIAERLIEAWGKAVQEGPR